MKLIPNVKQSWKMWSMRLAMLASVLQLPPLLFPEILNEVVNNFDEISQYIPEEFHSVVLLVLTIGIMVARVVDQGDIDVR